MMIDKDREEELRNQITEDIIEFVQTKGKEIQASNLDPYEQVVQVDVILDVIRFLDRYKENVRVLNQYYYSKSKFERY